MRFKIREQNYEDFGLKMNDYDLINSLLEDGSEQSLLKLKMIVNIESLDFGFINLTKMAILKALFKEYFDNVSYFITKQVQREIQKEIDYKILKELCEVSVKFNKHE